MPPESTDELSALATEQFNPATAAIDCLSSIEIVRLMNAEDARVAHAVEAELLLLGQVEQAHDRVLTRINGRAKIGALPKGDNSFSNPYRPNFLGSCCFKGQNSSAPEYVLRP